MPRCMRHRWTEIGLASLLALVANLARAADEPAKIDPQADQVLKAVSGLYGAANSLRAKITTTMNVQPADEKTVNVTSLKFVRPNRLSAWLESGQTGMDLVSDGEHLTMYIPALARYAVTDAPQQLDEVVSGPMKVLTLGQGLLFATPLLAAKPYEALTHDIRNLQYVGTEVIDGKKAHHLKLVESQNEWELWVDAGPQPTVLRAKPNLPKLLDSIGARLPDNVTIDLSVDFSEWDLAAKLTDDDFAFKAPEGAEKVDSLFGRRSEGPHPLVDKPAPEFDLKLLSGGSARLADHKGKDVVILDFWATWCGPCVQALPTIAAVAAEYRPKGVAFYAVNLEEEPEEIQAFLKERDLSVPVALDSNGQVGAAYGANAIPQTVIIDKQGTVAIVHVGLSVDLKAQLSRELDAILAGKKPEAKADE
ncbi:MAG TPA: DUF2092 domain-containing protein [Pirellulales bacterium]|nr:DUF2092 domain-containing protein [Pirellulales bacterium]